MTHYDKLVNLVSDNPANEDGEPWGMKLLPGLSEIQIAEIEKESGQKLSQNVIELFKKTSGIENGPMEIVGFNLKHKSYCYTGNAKNNFRLIAPDGFGNEWVVDYNNLNENFGPIFYYQHEGPMYFYQSGTIFDFIDEYVNFCYPPYKSKLDDVHDFRIKPLKTVNDGLAKVGDRDDILKEIRPLVKDSDIENVYFMDMSNAKVGDGFDLQGFKLLTVLTKGPIIVGKKKIGLWQKIFT